MTPGVAIRADGHPRVGGGHLSRCLALAARLRERGCEVVLICAAHEGTPWEGLRAAGVESVGIDAGLERDADFAAFRTAARAHFGRDTELVIVDHYALDACWEREAREAGSRVLALDDLADRAHHCDWLLDPNPVAGGRSAARVRYAAHVAPECELLLGPRYAPIRDEITERRAIRERAGGSRILVSLGASDPNGTTVKVVRALRGLEGPDARIDIVIGPQSAHGNRVCDAAGGDARFALHVAPPHYAALVHDADVAVGAAGVSALERCAVGVPSVVLSIADNQVGPARGLADAGAALYLGDAVSVSDAAILGAVTALVGSRELRDAMAARARVLVDGRGLERIADRLLCDHDTLTLRPLQAPDAELTFGWRNHPATREQSLDARPLDLATHRTWVSDSCRNPDRVLLLASDAKGRPFGVLRYDITGSRAHVSIYLDPARKGQGLGTRLLRAGMRWLGGQRREVERLTADVLPDNLASIAAFESAGFVQSHGVYEHRAPRAGA